jgi:hypothetical protein
MRAGGGNASKIIKRGRITWQYLRLTGSPTAVHACPYLALHANLYADSESIPMAAIEWEAAITALDSGGLPCSGGERRILQLSASLAAGTPASLRDTVTGLDDHNATRLITAIWHTAGNRPENIGRWIVELSSEQAIETGLAGGERDLVRDGVNEQSPRNLPTPPHQATAAGVGTPAHSRAIEHQ